MMKIKGSKLWVALIAAVSLFVCLAVFSFAADSNDFLSSFNYTAKTGDENAVIYSQDSLDGTKYMFLPSSADFSALTFGYGDASDVTMTIDGKTAEIANGSASDLSELFSAAAEEYNATVAYTLSDGTAGTVNLTIMKSANVDSLYLTSSDPVNYGRAWVDLSKTNEATGKYTLLSTSGKVRYSGSLTQIKPRGNTTFADVDKKSYQIKLDKKADLINDNKSEANKKWVLLANVFDSSMMHNITTFKLAEDCGLAYSPNSEFVDLYYDGEYRGTYQLSEKTEVGSSRIDIEDLDELIEDTNDGNEAYTNPKIVTATISSKGETTAKENSVGSYKYVSGLTEPSLADGTTHHGYLLELEFLTRYPDEMTGFITSRNQCVLTDNPEYLTKETGAYISQLWQDFEDAAYSDNGYNAGTGKYYYDYCDLDSLVNLYLVNELGKNIDAFRSSTYFYLPEDSDKFYAGPVWDYDRSYGIGVKNRNVAGNPKYFFAEEKYLINGLIKVESFRDAVKAALNKEDGSFYKAVQNMLGSEGTIKTNSNLILTSQAMNAKIWDITVEDYIVVKKGADLTCENAADYMENFVSERLEWLSNATSSWSGSKYTIETDQYNSDMDIFSRILYKFIQFLTKIQSWLNSLFK